MHRIRTPDLEVGKTYVYDIEAEWMEAGKVVVCKKTVEIKAGQTVNVFFCRADAEPEPPPEPTPEPPPQPKKEDHRQNFGIDTGNFPHLPFGEERYSMGGCCISREDALRLIGDRQLPDESSKLVISVIGTPDQTKRIMDDLQGQLAPFLNGFRKPKVYLPDSWEITGVGFRPKRTPYISIQTAEGVELHAQSDYDDGAPGLRKAIERLRKPNPQYDPSKTPDLRKDLPVPAPVTPNSPVLTPTGNTLFIVLLIAVVTFVAFKLPTFRRTQ